MSRPREYTDRERKQSRFFSVLLYPDSESYNFDDVLKIATSTFYQFAYILHCEDHYVSEDLEDYIADTGKSPEWKIGDKKKEHIHLFLDNKYPIALGRVSKIIGIPSNYIQCKDNKLRSIQYLIHLNNPERAQYNPNDVVSNIPKIKDKYLKDNDCVMKAEKIIEYIESCNFRLTVTAVAKWAIVNLCWDEFRRGQHIFTALINEHNSNYVDEGVKNAY